MATVGLSFGSPTSGAGFDVASTVTSILATQSGVETAWKSQLSTLQTQDTAFTSLGTDLATLSTSLSSLTSFDGLFASKEGSSSNPDVLSLSSASTTAVAGSHTVVVNSLATTSSKYTGSITATDTLSGTLSIQVGSGTAKTITIGSGNNTLATLASAINQGSYGVTASVITDANGSRLSLVSSTSGAAGSITLGGALTDSTTSSAINFTTGQPGADASLTVDGLDTTSASNTVTGAISGVTFQLLAASTTPVQVQITNDNSSIETAVQSVVTAYNAVVADIKTQEGKDSTGAAEPLFGNPTLSLIQTRLSQALSGGAASGSIATIDQIGLSIGQDGTLTLDTSALDTALNSHFSDVEGFFETAGSWGQTLTTTLNQLGSSSTQGAVSLALAQNSTVETSLNTDVSNEDALLATEKTTLTAELNTANETLQSIPAQLNEQNILYSSLTGYVASTL
ncbi:flagellar hook-associated protein 2 [Granulicella rosea]|uniref:Flagellar hook-associated protein 2 n=1 Tax=Granulicella rosea TaxID=474952 RepID=A0A239IRK8_9BACT|nr:flagellar filament capping protein FliD [Granulicella rosea]SNS96426.1 flagellar hook-associated protein 2 [Granulicella rosea]